MLEFLEKKPNDRPGVAPYIRFIKKYTIYEWGSAWDCYGFRSRLLASDWFLFLVPGLPRLPAERVRSLPVAARPLRIYRMAALGAGGILYIWPRID